MKPTFSLGRIAGISIGVHWSVLAMMVLVTEIVAVGILPARAPGLGAVTYWLTGVVASVTFLASLLGHELAHAVVARRFRMRADRITLWLLGGFTELGSHPPTPRAAFLVAAAGPGASLAIAAGFGLLAFGAGFTPLPAVVAAVLAWLALVNGVLGVFNLLPGAPLDGGRLLQALLWKRTGDQSGAAVTAAKAGRVVGVVLIVLGVVEVVSQRLVGGIWLALIGWFLIVSASTEASSVSLRDRLAGVRLRDVMSPAPPSAPEWWTAETFLDRMARADRHRAFPVVDMDGRPIRVVTLADLVRLAPGMRAHTRLAELGRPVRQDSVADPADLLTELPASAWPSSSDRSLLFVADANRLVGMLTAKDVSRAIELANLGHLPSGSDSPGPPVEEPEREGPGSAPPVPGRSPDHGHNA
ncbi:site-2 protease family protein [Actinopolymorpha pittospori]|uniref:Zinc metalloprotease n=1 Tax=Actinopolymorpha pittospori TaxID=648752 RepID=A0A927N486_9ACTN|nr:site-2 protease family protein [Actinopolymorpha pittospori]MBE1611437.1 Zn-dependent protease [Actinopolymorpha pittospori]